MAVDSSRLREALSSIAVLAQKAIADDGTPTGGQDRLAPGCVLRTLPDRLQQRAVRLASSINPVNAPGIISPAHLGGPQRLTLLVPRWWGARPRQLGVSFMEPTPADLRTRIIENFNAWNVGVSFVETAGTGEIRVSRESGGHWSYLGTDVLLIPADEPTMNLERFTMSTSEQEYKRVVRHEAGHTLGFPHEHMRRELVERIDPGKAYAYFWRTQGWDRNTVDQQVLTPLEEETIFGTRLADSDSCMCYQLPQEITRDGQPILGGTDINDNDHAFAAKVYPRTPPPASARATSKDSGYDWGRERDVSDEKLRQYEFGT